MVQSSVSASSRRFLVCLFLVSSLSVAPSWSYLPSMRSSVPMRSLRSTSMRKQCRLRAAPKRLEENADGILYVNDRCINCSACANFAPTVFGYNEGISKHVVFNQPTIDQREQLEEARSALAACPVAAIRVESNVDVDVNDEKDGRVLKDAFSIQHDQLFPQPVCPISTVEGVSVDIGTYYLGHHNDASFGAVPYLILGKSQTGKDISVMVDVPRFSPSAVRAVKSLTQSGPDYMLLTHVDDTADHSKWKEEFPALKRIFHSGDLGRHNWIGDLTLEDVEILLQNDDESNAGDDLAVWDIDGNQLPANALERIGQEEFRVLHTPGHSPGSISLLFRPKSQPFDLECTPLLSKDNKNVKYPSGVLFTGDTYVWTIKGGCDGYMSGIPRYGKNLPLQAATLQKLGNLRHAWDIIAPGHGHVRSYLDHDDAGSADLDGIKLDEMNGAVEELRSYPENMRFWASRPY